MFRFCIKCKLDKDITEFAVRKNCKTNICTDYRKDFYCGVVDITIPGI